MRVEVKQGLDLPGTGLDVDGVEAAPPPRTVALVGPDYGNLKPSLAIDEGAIVRAGESLFTHRPTPLLRFAAPASGRVAAIHRGARRALEAVVIEVDDPGTVERPAVSSSPLSGAGLEDVRQALLASGLWTAFRTRPFDRVPHPAARPRALFVTAIDTAPYAPDPAVVIAPRADDFHAGIACLTLLSPERVYVCTADAADWPLPREDSVQHVRFTGPHPAGLPGTHIHFLDPAVSLAADTWHIGYQDVLALGVLFRTGCLDLERIVAVAGPAVKRQRLVRTRLGAEIDTLLEPSEAFGQRVVSGSLFSGRHVTPATAFLGRYDNQITLLPEASGPAPQPWSLLELARDLRPAWRRHLGRLDTAANGRSCGMIAVEAFHRIWPFPTPPALLLRALLNGDATAAADLGCLALAPADLALATWVCPAKINYGRALEDTLQTLEQSG